MSGLSITPFFRFCKVKVTDMFLHPNHKSVTLTITSDRRFLPICIHCLKPVATIHSYRVRSIRDLPVVRIMVDLKYRYRKLRCPSCGVKIETHDFVNPGMRVTRRLAQYIADLCRVMTVKEVANHLDLDWKTVKAIDKQALNISLKPSIGTVYGY